MDIDLLQKLIDESNNIVFFWWYLTKRDNAYSFKYINL